MLNISNIYTNVRKLAFIILLIILGWQQWRVFKNYEEPFLNPVAFVKKNYANDDISQYINRVQEAKKMFPGQGSLTYASEQHVPNAGTRDYHYALTQYYLAPRVFFRNNLMPETLLYDYGSAPITPSSVVCDTVLYNLYMTLNPNPETDYYLKNGWHLIHNFNNGIVILAK